MGLGQIEEGLGKRNGSVPHLYSDCHLGQGGIEDMLPQKSIEVDHIEVSKIWLGRTEVYGVKVYRRCDNCGTSMILSRQKDGKLVVLECPKCEEQMFFGNCKLPGLKGK